MTNTGSVPKLKVGGAKRRRKPGAGKKAKKPTGFGGMLARLSTGY
jgi:hypothetical protein